MSLLSSKNLFSCILAAALILACSGTAFSGEGANMHIGAMEFHPFAVVDQSYDSNIALEPPGQEDEDFITDLKLGMKINSPLVPQREEDLMLVLSYQADLIKFWDHDDRDRTDHIAGALLDLTFANDFGLKIKDDFEITENPPDTERTALEERFRNVLDTAIFYDREKIRFLAGYRNIRDDYDDVDNLDRTDNMFTGAFFYQLSPKIAVFTEYNYGVISYDTNQTNSDSEYHQGWLGLQGNLLPKVTGTVKAGYRNAGYDEADKEDFSGFALYGKIEYNATERTTINLSAEMTSEESSYSTNSYYEMNGVNVDLSHQVTERFWLNSGGSYSQNRYPDATTEGTVTRKRRDDIWGLNAGMKYEIRRWWFIRVAYEFSERDSNFAVFDYTDHKASAEIAFHF